VEIACGTLSDVAGKPYTIIDSRRVDARGRRREALKITGKREIHFEDVRKPLQSAFRYFRAQVEHLPGRRWPRSGESHDLLRELVRRFIISTHQLYTATISLMADNRTPALVMPAGVVARALVEGLGNLLAILEAPNDAAEWFLKDDYLNRFRRWQSARKRFGNTAGVEKETRSLKQGAQDLKLTPEEIASPEKRLQEWPTPRRLLDQGRLTGERGQVFEEIYDFWYKWLSALAHHRFAALQAAVYTEEQPSEETFVMVKSVTATLAVSIALCVLSEVEAFYELPPNPPLRAAWERMRDADEIIKAIYRMRYARLLQMDLASTK